jgi:hypothetical protein
MSATGGSPPPVRVNFDRDGASVRPFEDGSIASSCRSLPARKFCNLAVSIMGMTVAGEVLSGIATWAGPSSGDGLGVERVRRLPFEDDMTLSFTSRTRPKLLLFDSVSRRMEMACVVRKMPRRDNDADHLLRCHLDWSSALSEHSHDLARIAYQGVIWSVTRSHTPVSYRNRCIRARKRLTRPASYTTSTIDMRTGVHMQHLSNALIPVVS